jgi:hypothetical protein
LTIRSAGVDDLNGDWNLCDERFVWVWFLLSIGHTIVEQLRAFLLVIRPDWSLKIRAGIIKKEAIIEI